MPSTPLSVWSPSSVKVCSPPRTAHLAGSAHIERASFRCSAHSPTISVYGGIGTRRPGCKTTKPPWLKGGRADDQAVCTLPRCCRYRLGATQGHVSILQPPRQPRGRPALRHKQPTVIESPLAARSARRRHGGMTFYSVFATWIRAHFDDERGASLVEYALLVALIAVVCIAAITLLGNNASTKFSEVGASLN